jgi:HPt (histidine-containing phosphotransfer) domain-containing protein
MIAAGVDDVITKPVEPAKLRNTLEKLFGDRISYSHHIPATPPIPPPTVVERGAKAKISIYALDHEGMRNRVGNNLKLFYNILRCFKDDAAETCSRVTIAWRGRNREELLQATHALKGVILCSGCTPAVNLIEQLERDEFFGAKGEQLLEELEVAVHELVQEAERKLDEASES